MASLRIRLFIAAMAVLTALLSGARPAAAQYSEFAPAGEGFSVQFPPNPTFRPDQPSGDVIAHNWHVSTGGYFFYVGRGTPKNRDLIIDADATLKGDQHDVITGLKANLLRSDRITWPGPEGPLPALLFTMGFDDKRYGEYLETIHGNLIYGVMVIAQTDSPAIRDEVDRVVRSLRITK
jgi:hypothetical protein